MKYIVRPTSRFQRDLKWVQRRGYDLSLLAAVSKKLLHHFLGILTVSSSDKHNSKKLKLIFYCPNSKKLL